MSVFVVISIKKAMFMIDKGLPLTHSPGEWVSRYNKTAHRAYGRWAVCISKITYGFGQCLTRGVVRQRFAALCGMAKVEEHQNFFVLR